MSVLGINQARATVLHALIQYRAVTAVQVQSDYGIPRHTAFRHLLALEEADVVHADVSADEPRNGRAVLFTLNEGPLVAAIEHFERHVDPRRNS